MAANSHGHGIWVWIWCGAVFFFMGVVVVARRSSSSSSSWCVVVVVWCVVRCCVLSLSSAVSSRITYFLVGLRLMSRPPDIAGLARRRGTARRPAVVVVVVVSRGRSSFLVVEAVERRASRPRSSWSPCRCRTLVPMFILFFLSSSSPWSSATTTSY